ncbi:MAG TPA: hypothetical protein GYA07_05370 [Verrucomicrobia bacterium]|nr:hypothetical protein [Verrucomicrobiota bacterium]HOP96941.1 SAM-dependent methyltransferase [Verrucomicrobiota bacterium]
MELALYCPVYGYYEKEKDIGKRGDFFTSASVGGLFGELLAHQFAQWLDGCPGAGGLLTIVEAGAHDGRLAADVLGALRTFHPRLFDSVSYCVIEPSASRQERQRRRLAGFAGKVVWADDLPSAAALRGGTIRGVIFSNELLDAMPVRRVAWDAKRRRWFEWGVGCGDGGFVWAPFRDVESREVLGELDGAIEEVLPDGFTTEIGEAAVEWWKEAARWLDRGRLVTFDYGFTLEERFRPERVEGTLRAYRGHQVSRDVLRDPGEQDLTAHVDFTAIRRAGESAGLQTEALVRQEQFLMGIVRSVLSAPSTFGEWTPERRRQLQTLTHPEHLGRSFRVLVQARS